MKQQNLHVFRSFSPKAYQLFITSVQYLEGMIKMDRRGFEFFCSPTQSVHLFRNPSRHKYPAYTPAIKGFSSLRKPRGTICLPRSDTIADVVADTVADIIADAVADGYVDNEENNISLRPKGNILWQYFL